MDAFEISHASMEINGNSERVLKKNCKIVQIV